METQNYFVVNDIFKQNAKTYQTKPVLATKYKPGMETGWMIYISNVPRKNEKFHTHAAIKFFPTIKAPGFKSVNFKSSPKYFEVKNGLKTE